MRAITNMSRIKVGGHNINSLRYADDTVLIADNEKDIQELLDIVVAESEYKGLSLNSKKTEQWACPERKLTRMQCTNQRNNIKTSAQIHQMADVSRR